MTKIPEDVLKAAREAYLTVPTTPTDAWFVKSVREGDYDHQMPIKASARAILAERERCEAEAARLRGLLAEAGKALEPFAAQAASYDPDEGDGELPVWDFDTKIRELRTARTVATKIEEALK